MDHDQLNEYAMASSSREAERRGLRAGDEVVSGGDTYRIVAVVRNHNHGPRRSPGVYAKRVATHGRFVLPPEHDDMLDLRQPGWTRLPREDSGATGACGIDETDGPAGVNGVPR